MEVPQVKSVSSDVSMTSWSPYESSYVDFCKAFDWGDQTPNHGFLDRVLQEGRLTAMDLIKKPIR